MPETISINDVIVNGEPTIAPDTEGGGTGTAYTTGDPASTTINDTDYFPLSDANGNRKKTLWSNIVNKLKSIFNPPITDIVNIYGAKNLIPYPYHDTTKTMNGITFTDNGDGTITANGTATDTAFFTLASLLELEDGEYILTGDYDTESAYNTSAILFNANTSSGTSYWNYGADKPVRFTIGNTVQKIVSLRIRITSGKTVNNQVFKPMIRLASIQDDTWVPYAKTNKQLTEDTLVTYKTTDSASTTINDTDYIPMSDSSGNRKKSLWSNIVYKLKDIFLSLTGGTISGDITYKFTDADLTKANNNVSSVQYPTTFNILDVGSRIFARLEGKVHPNGDTGTYWYIRNYNTSGAQVAQKGIEMRMTKDGTFSYLVEEESKFRSAIHAAYSSANNGVADNATKVNNWFSSRPTSANVQFGDGFLRHFKATSAMTTGKPTIGDAHIIDLAWDGNNGYDVQLAIGNSNSGIQYRSQLAGVWQDWLTLINSANIGSQTVKRTKELNYATDTTDLNSVNGNGWYSIAEAKNAIYSEHKPLAINWYWGIDIRTRGITYTQINGYQILTTENGVPKTGGTFTGNVIVNTGTSAESDLILGAASGSEGGILLYAGGSTHIHASSKSAATSVTLPSSSGTIALTSSSRRIKKNIRAITEEEAQKLLDIDVIKFDYKEGWGDGKENHAGFIAEDVQKIIPETVIVHKNYDPNLPVDVEYNFPPEMDYQKFIPYLVKMVQMQQEQINELKAEIKTLKEG